VCPRCGAAERHRLLWLWLRDRLPQIRRLLVFAPDDATDARLRRHGVEYVSADIDATQAMVAADITALPFEDGAFDAIVCLHVLEHVDDEAAALRELRRVASGWVVVMVPVDRSVARTIEGAASTPAQRLSRFGHPEHVRLYGADVAQRLEADRVDLLAELGAVAARRHGLVRSDRFGPDDLFLLRTA
jgi:SAM-dependent methyltransferase